jgi:hypothetical protein
VAVASVPTLLPLNAGGALRGIEELPHDTPSCGKRDQVPVLPLCVVHSKQAELGRALGLRIANADVVAARAGLIYINKALDKPEEKVHRASVRMQAHRNWKVGPSLGSKTIE